MFVVDLLRICKIQVQLLYRCPKIRVSEATTSVQCFVRRAQNSPEFNNASSGLRWAGAHEYRYVMKMA
jgi:hypothetical protein